MNNKFPKGIEAAAAGLVRRKDGKLLFAKSPKWSNKWVIPGGHIEPGESIKDAVIREVKEETQLDSKFITILLSGEMINPSNYKRQAHFVYFTCLLSTDQEEPQLDNNELVEYKWLTAEEALHLDLSYPNESVLKKYMDYLKTHPLA
jgi:nucleoside triphosphatase